jgi:Ca2+:H+ antiporter
MAPVTDPDADADETSALLSGRVSLERRGSVSAEHLELFPEYWSQQRPRQQPLAVLDHWKRLLPYSWMRYRFNVLLVLVPLGLVGDLLHASPLVIFLSNFLGIFPLGILLGRFTEDIAWYSSAAWGALLNATFGNAVELIFAIAALRHHMTDVLKATMLGSIIGNELFVTGFCFLLGGLYFREQSFAPTFSDTNMSVLYIATIGLLFPTVFDQAIHTHRKQTTPTEETWDLRVSRWTALALLMLYIAYLVFELYTHAQSDARDTHMPMRDADRSVHGSGHVSRGKPWTSTHPAHAPLCAAPCSQNACSPSETELSCLESGSQRFSVKRHSASSSGEGGKEHAVIDPEDGADAALTQEADREQPSNSLDGAANIETVDGTLIDGPEMSLWANAISLLTCTVLISLCTDRLVGALDAAAAALALPPTFISFILMPLVGNIAEHLGAVSMAMQNKMDLAVRIAIGSAVQIGLMVFPVLVLIAWVIDTPLTLQIPMFGAFALVASTVVVVNTMRDSTSNWLEGLELLAVYLITCVCFYYTT